jgi:hypothetical protein
VSFVVALLDLISIRPGANVFLSDVTSSVAKLATGASNNLVVAAPIEVLTDNPRRLIFGKVTVNAVVSSDTGLALARTWSLVSELCQGDLPLPLEI